MLKLTLEKKVYILLFDISELLGKSRNRWLHKLANICQAKWADWYEAKIAENDDYEPEDRTLTPCGCRFFACWECGSNAVCNAYAELAETID